MKKVYPVKTILPVEKKILCLISYFSRFKAFLLKKILPVKKIQHVKEISVYEIYFFVIL